MLSISIADSVPVNLPWEMGVQVLASRSAPASGEIPLPNGFQTSSHPLAKPLMRDFPKPGTQTVAEPLVLGDYSGKSQGTELDRCRIVKDYDLVFRAQRIVYDIGNILFEGLSKF
ncbi:hypothetical protein HNY73_017145 [Argiope bruennichi]|uniref:Uncharacterized protein n=1 Tax=Argiope bruennichi TaxID=94029 RepID=A0A8T0EKN3_ARGBR|nr:hypothetical protein HNY73_017145 [Argiope bruennichi]